MNFKLSYCFSWPLERRLSKPWHPVHTHRNPKSVVAGQVYELAIWFNPIANLFKRGIG
ncbi:hypothetical protein ACFLXL_02460 [Chloroflexota bacterium]